MTEDTERKLKLMVVDDEPDNLALLYRTFRREFDVIKADSAIAALKLLDEQGEMAIIISDQRMPEMLGTEFLSKTVDRFPDTIRIVLTGYTDVEDLVEAINAGKVFKYITKPWIPDQLKVVVQQAAETYQMVKQRTQELQRALRQESLFNAVTTAIRESLDYESMLHTIAATLGQTFAARDCVLQPVEGDSLATSVFRYTSCPHPSPATTDHPADLPTRLLSPDNSLLQTVFATHQIQTCSSDTHGNHLIAPLIYQDDFLAVLAMARPRSDRPWSAEDLNLLRGVIEQAALAISQAKLYQRSQKQNRCERNWKSLARFRRIFCAKAGRSWMA
jgi:CheY-like chemotaxis protein